MGGRMVLCTASLLERYGGIPDPQEIDIDSGEFSSYETSFTQDTNIKYMKLPVSNWSNTNSWCLSLIHMFSA